MQAIEFEADAKGRMIEIPKEFAAFASKHLKVKISTDEYIDNPPTKPAKRLSAISIDTRSFKFNREDANANVIFYRPTHYGIRVVRILHQSMDSERHLP